MIHGREMWEGNGRDSFTKWRHHPVFNIMRVYAQIKDLWVAVEWGQNQEDNHSSSILCYAWWGSSGADTLLVYFIVVGGWWRWKTERKSREGLGIRYGFGWSPPPSAPLCRVGELHLSSFVCWSTIHEIGETSLSPSFSCAPVSQSVHYAMYLPSKLLPGDRHILFPLASS